MCEKILWILVLKAYLDHQLQSPVQFSKTDVSLEDKLIIICISILRPSSIL